MSDSLQPHGLQHTRLPSPSPTPRAYLNSCPLSQWCHPTISSSVVPFSSCSQSFPGSGSFLTSQFFTSGGQSIRVSALVLPVNIQDWFPFGLTGLISLKSTGFAAEGTISPWGTPNQEGNVLGHSCDLKASFTDLRAITVLLTVGIGDLSLVWGSERGPGRGLPQVGVPGRRPSIEAPGKAGCCG